MAITKITLRERVAEHLRISSPDRELDAATAARIDASIADARAELMERGLCWWGEDAIPNSVVFALTLICSAQAAAKTGRMGQGYEDGDGEGRIRLAALKPTADVMPVMAEYF